MKIQKNLVWLLNLPELHFHFYFLLVLSSLLSGILNTNNKFAAAAAPNSINIILILSLLISFYFNQNIAKNLSIGVTLAGILQFLILIFFTKKFYFPSIKFF